MALEGLNLEKIEIERDKITTFDKMQFCTYLKLQKGREFNDHEIAPFAIIRMPQICNVFTSVAPVQSHKYLKYDNKI